MQDRIDTLEQISGLVVKVRTEKRQNVFEFYFEGRCIKTIFTYDKAKCFAEGVRFGRQHAYQEFQE